MKHLLFLSLLLGFIAPVNAESFCTLKSKVEPEVTLEMYKPYGGYGFGTLNYKNKPEFFLQIGITNGYGGQYYHLQNYDPSAISYDPKLKYLYLDHKKLESIGYGSFVNFVGDQLTRSTPIENRKPGILKAFMPKLTTQYYYSLSTNHKKEEYDRFNISPKMKAIINASEGFFVDSGGCRKYFIYGWN